MIKIKYFIAEKGYLFFQVGIFLILSAPNFSAIFFLLSLFSSHLNEKKVSQKINWLIPFFVAGLVAIISAINSSARYTKLDGWSGYLSWIGLANWLPFFYFTWRFQIYLYTNKMRERIANLFLAGSIPFIFSAFGQTWFNWHGPLVLMNGIIIWFQRAIDTENGGGMTAMFNNQNYAACWLIIIWPFCINNFFKLRQFNLKKILFLTYSVLILICIFLTKSRNGIMGTLSSSIILGNKYFLYFILIIIFLYLITTFSFFPKFLQVFFKKIFSNKNYDFFKITKYANLLNEPRIFIYMNSIPIIMEKPFLGWGAATFPILFELRYEDFTRDPTHPHNLILEMSFSYGIIFALIISITIILILIYSFKKIFIKKSLNINDNKGHKDNSLDKAWWTSCFSLLLSQMYDIQYFDFRISVSLWILITGLICIV